MEYGFSTQDWTTINGISAEGRLIAKFIDSVRYVRPDGTILEIPKYQPTDYASVPESLWGAPLFLIPYGWYSLPAALHDSAFQNLLLLVHADGTKTLVNYTESQSNDLLREAMQSVKPNPTAFEKAQMDAIYWGVTEGGYHSYKQDRS